MIKAVLFDLENTLIMKESYTNEVDAVICHEIAKTLSCSAEEAKVALEHARSKFSTTTMALESFGLPRNILYKRLGAWEPKRSTAAVQGGSVTLQLLRSRGLKLGVITNMPRLLATKILKAADIEPSIFDVFITGSDITCAKPAREPFLRALSLLGMVANECIMVGDREQVDLRTAKEMGMVTVLFNGQSVLAHYEISALKEVVHLLDVLNSHQGAASIPEPLV